MTPKEKKHNYFYKISNLVNGKYYYGIHSTNNLDDGYLGSGRTVIKAVNKYGRENFTKEIIADYPTRKEASDHERRVVTLYITTLDECYNIRCGGDNENIHSQDTKNKLSIIGSSKTGSLNSFYGKTHSTETIEHMRNIKLHTTASLETRHKLSESLKKANHPCKIKGIGNPLYGHKHTSEFCENIKIRQSGKSNSFYGKSHSLEFKERLRDTCPHTKSCLIKGTLYKSTKEACRILDIKNSTMRHRLKSTLEKWSDWKYVTD